MSLLIAVSIALLTVYPLPENYLLFLGLRVLLLLSLLLCLFKGFSQLIIKNDQTKERRKNLAVSVFSVLILLLLLEIIFTLIPRSHGVGYAYSARNWRLYYHDHNELGFRDTPIDEKDFNKKVVLFLGDSFTEGAGIKSMNDRFSNLVHEEIEDHFEMMIYAKGGMNTVDQLAAIKGLDFKPNMIIFQYYGNDIEGDAINLGKERPKINRYSDLNFFFAGMVRSSYLFNYLYWLFPRDYLEGYHSYLVDNYQNKEVFEKHAASLNAILDYCHKNDIALFCIVIPFLQDIEWSEDLYLNKVTSILDNQAKNSKVISVINELKAIPVNKRIVNKNDAHANEYVNTIIAKKLISELGFAR